MKKCHVEILFAWGTFILFLFCQIFSSIFNTIQKPISGIHHLVTYFASRRANFELFYHSTWNDEQQKMDHLTWKNNPNTSWCGGDSRSVAQCDKFTKKCSILLPLLFCWFFEQLGFFPLFNMILQHKINTKYLKFTLPKNWTNFPPYILPAHQWCGLQIPISA